MAHRRVVVPTTVPVPKESMMLITCCVTVGSVEKSTTPSITNCSASGEGNEGPGLFEPPPPDEQEPRREKISVHKSMDVIVVIRFPMVKLTLKP